MGSGLPVGSVRARYLVYFQYLGTDFNGVAAVRGAQRAAGVQNYLEEAAEGLKSVLPVKFTISSRTDAGVHALSNAAHLDIQRRSGQPPFSPEVLTQALNTHLRHPAIRVLKAFRVPSDFHARYSATSRTYLYRLATGCPQYDQLSVFERNRCWALRADCLDVVAMQEAAHHLLGTHDFSAFQSAGSPSSSSVRTLRRASVSPGPASPFVLPQESSSWESSLCPAGMPGPTSQGGLKTSGQRPVAQRQVAWGEVPVSLRPKFPKGQTVGPESEQGLPRPQVDLESIYRSCFQQSQSFWPHVVCRAHSTEARDDLQVPSQGQGMPGSLG
ncbi:tRNA pseudouridine synthase-like 1 isoform X2 [Sturnira hondurensis]|uniref:tRNA pseudouridine synthase-like 1 isoform X2 n=1 Tax=Sturnira hondurensis TaxID=192404 RepID=UPI00187AE57A|nr:tRNA pseudouridine synthase-like 1 isoform X2 [Sturnira hondurensis]